MEVLLTTRCYDANLPSINLINNSAISNTPTAEIIVQQQTVKLNYKMRDLIKMKSQNTRMRERDMSISFGSNHWYVICIEN